MPGDDRSGDPFDDAGTDDEKSEHAADADREPIDLSADADAEGAADTDSEGAADTDREGAAADIEDGTAATDATEPFEEMEVEEGVDDPFAELEANAGESPREFPEGLDAEAGDVDVESDPFEEMEVEDLDEEEVWAALSEAEEAAVELGGEATPVETEEGPSDHIVDKREYCQQCPHFTEPPTVSCNHEGTEIVEVVSADEFRVRGCPMIGEQGPTFKQE